MGNQNQQPEPKQPSLWEVLKTKIQQPELGAADMELARKREGK